MRSRSRAPCSSPWSRRKRRPASSTLVRAWERRAERRRRTTVRAWASSARVHTRRRPIWRRASAVATTSRAAPQRNASFVEGVAGRRIAGMEEESPRVGRGRRVPARSERSGKVLAYATVAMLLVGGIVLAFGVWAVKRYSDGQPLDLNDVLPAALRRVPTPTTIDALCADAERLQAAMLATWERYGVQFGGLSWDEAEKRDPRRNRRV